MSNILFIVFSMGIMLSGYLLIKSYYLYFKEKDVFYPMISFRTLMPILMFTYSMFLLEHTTYLWIQILLLICTFVIYGWLISLYMDCVKHKIKK